jgi:hypothetical protein
VSSPSECARAARRRTLDSPSRRPLPSLRLAQWQTAAYFPELNSYEVSILNLPPDFNEAGVHFVGREKETTTSLFGPIESPFDNKYFRVKVEVFNKGEGR